MPQQYFASEYNVWPKDRQQKAPPAADVTASANLWRGPTVADLPTPADAANTARSSVPPPVEKASQTVTIYPRSMSHEQPIYVPLYSYAQLDRCSVKGLKLIVSKLQDTVQQAGADVPSISISSHSDVVIRWILDVQVKLAKDAGLDVSTLSFGVE